VSGCAIVAGDLYCWGTPTGPTPTQIPLGAPATAVAAGKNFSCVIADMTRCWGQNDTGQCGTGSVAPPATPTSVNFIPAYPATQIDAGDDHACAFAPGQPPQCWGHNDSGALGTGSMSPTTSLDPVDVIGGLTSLPRIAGWHACGLVGSNVWCWGEGNSGELGNGMTNNSATPVMVTGLSNVTAFETGGGPTDHDASCAISGGNVSCWGRGEFGRLGNGMTTSESMPVAVLGLPGAASEIAVGFAHACAVVGNDIWCWGRGDRGQLGDGNKTDSMSPVKVTRPPT